MKFAAALLFLASSCSAFAPALHTTSRATTSLNIVVGDDENILDKIKRIISEEATPPVDPDFDEMVQSKFPGAIDNGKLEQTVVKVLAEKGFTSANTLLATSLCCDELARKLEDDFVKIYGNNFNLGGLSGFPFAGNTGFGAMAAHIPDDG